MNDPLQSTTNDTLYDESRLSYADVTKLNSTLEPELDISFNINANISPEINQQILGEDPWNTEDNNAVNINGIFANVNLPLSFERTFKMALPDEENQITVAALDKIISSCGLPKVVSNKILFLVLGMNQTHISKTELFVILGLIGLAQKNMDVTIENLELYKNDLPEPSLSGLENINFHSLRKQRQKSDNMNDPWRTSQRVSKIKAEEKGGSISSVGTSTKVGTNKSKLGVDDIPTIGEDSVTIKESKEMGGIIFKFVNYIVTSKVRNCSVIRRYSDFYWLNELLYKRYPYRMLPILPPKKFGGNKAFFDERKIGLNRYINFLVVHPVLKDDSMLNVFLTEPVEITTYRAENTVHTFEEFKFTRFNFDTYNLDDQLILQRKERAKKELELAIKQYDKICLALKRITLRQQASGKDYVLLSQALSSLADYESRSFENDPLNLVPIFNQYNEVATYFDKAGIILINDAETLDNEALEGFRIHHLHLIALKELIERVDSKREVTIEEIKERIHTQQIVVDSLPNDPTHQIEAQRIQNLINSDEKELQEQEKRVVFINYCLISEFDYFHSKHSQMLANYQQLANLELTHHTQLSRVWKNVANIVDLLPNCIPPKQNEESPKSKNSILNDGE
ncbi:PX-domain-containing protein [Neoconidiobolus thromboides FSU 785]|nr:PX-domain-containing protein [Neoconidiobolus thromboides FSU 785]